MKDSVRSASPRGGYYRFWDGAAGLVFAFVVPASFVFMVALLLAGLLELWNAMKAFEWRLSWEQSAHPPDNELHFDASIHSTIHALELFILGPLPYMVLSGLAGYITQHTDKNLHTRLRAEANFPKVKAIIASVLVSTVAVHLVGMVLREDPSSPLDLKIVGSELLIIIVLSAYFVVMEKIASSHTASGDETGKAHEAKDDAGPTAHT
jgi:hypothetical protein